MATLWDFFSVYNNYEIQEVETEAHSCHSHHLSTLILWYCEIQFSHPHSACEIATDCRANPDRRNAEVTCLS